MRLVIDSGPLIALAGVGRLDLLALFPEVLIPPVVKSEILAKPGADQEALERALADRLVVKATAAPGEEMAAELASLDLGERAAIVLAYQQKCLLLIDDRLGRRVAKRLGVAVTGLAGLLLMAKERGMISAVCPLLEEIRSRGYWLSDELLAKVGALAGEL